MVSSQGMQSRPLIHSVGYWGTTLVWNPMTLLPAYRPEVHRSLMLRPSPRFTSACTHFTISWHKKRKGVQYGILREREKPQSHDFYYGIVIVLFFYYCNLPLCLTYK